MFEALFVCMYMIKNIQFRLILLCTADLRPLKKEMHFLREENEVWPSVRSKKSAGGQGTRAMYRKISIFSKEVQMPFVLNWITTIND